MLVGFERFHRKADGKGVRRNRLGTVIAMAILSTCGHFVIERLSTAGLSARLDELALGDGYPDHRLIDS
jgi:hypothetical protein